MKDLENHHIGHGEPLRHADEHDPGSYDYHNEAADALSMFGCLGTCIMIAVLLLFGLCSCTPKTVTIREEVPVFLHDTITNVTLRVDSFTERDSIYFETFIKGDTVSLTKYVEKWRTKTNIKHDTIIHEIEVPVTYTECTEVEVEVPAKLTKGQHLLMALGKWMIAVLVLGVLAIVCYIYRIFSGRKK